jgi:hypothetical protein
MIEGYVVLAYELIAIRQVIPYVGSGADTIAIIIAAVLMPLAFGYYAGGRFEPNRNPKNGEMLKRVREQLSQNLRRAAMVVVVGISFLPMEIFFKTLLDMGIHDRLLMTAVYSAVFLIYPVFLLGQTIPLVSHFFSKSQLPKVTGTMLFVSTIGSFMGAVFTTIVLMSFIGVHNTAIFCLAMVALLLFMIGGKMAVRNLQTAIAIVLLGFFMNSSDLLKELNVVDYNQYNLIRVFDDKDGNRHMSLNGNASSKLSPEGIPHDYIKYMDDYFITIPTEQDIKNGNYTPKDILVIGAGGFTVGLKDTVNQYDFIDIDSNLQAKAEEHFLPAPLSDNKTFIAEPARAFMSRTDKTYDLIILDAYLGHITIPPHLATVDFLLQARSKLKPGGHLIMNVIVSASFHDEFSRNLDSTIRAAFPFVTRQIIDEYHADDVPQEGTKINDLVNALYIYHQHRPALLKQKQNIYTDDMNRIMLDLPRGTRY